MKNKPIVIDLFCGCGGLSYGFIEAGYDVLLGIDHWKDAIVTFENTHKNAKGLVADLFTDTPKDISKKVCLPKHTKEEKILSHIKVINISTEKVIDNLNLKQRSHLWPDFLACKVDTYLDINQSDMK